MNYIRIHKVRLPSRLSECQGAGTGCGWCRVFMEQLVERIDTNAAQPEDLDVWLAAHLPAAQAYARGRARYLARGKVRGENDLECADQPDSTE